MVEVTLPAEPRAAAIARRHVRDLPLEEEAIELVSLLVTELITNAVRHGRFSRYRNPRITLHLDLARDGTVHIDVVNEGPGFEPEPATTEIRDGGLGLRLVDRLARRWGVEANGETKVWLELPVPSGRGRPAMRSAPA